MHIFYVCDFVHVIYMNMHSIKYSNKNFILPENKYSHFISYINIIMADSVLIN